MSVIIGAYKRIRDASKKGKGVRLSAKEVSAMWNDNAICSAVESYDIEEQDRREAEKGESS